VSICESLQKTEEYLEMFTNIQILEERQDKTAKIVLDLRLLMLCYTGRAAAGLHFRPLPAARRQSTGKHRVTKGKEDEKWREIASVF